MRSILNRSGYSCRVKTPTFIQTENSDCGATSLRIILAYYKCFVPLADLRIQCGVSRDGVNNKNLVEAAKKYGMSAVISRQTPKENSNFTTPVIIFWNRRHFIVLEGFRGNKVYINDPNTGHRLIDREVFDKNFSGMAIHLTPTKIFKKIKKKQLFLQKLKEHLQEEWSTLSFMLLATTLLACLNLATPLFSRFYTDNYFIPLQVKSLNHGFTHLFVLMAFVIILQGFFIYLRRKMMRRLETKLTKRFNSKLTHRLLSLPAVFFAHRHAGDLMQRLQSTDKFAELFTGPIFNASMGFIQLFLYLSLMIYYSPVLSLIVCLISLFNLLCFYSFKTRQRQLSAKNKQEMTTLTALTMSDISMISQIKAMGCEGDFFLKWKAQLVLYLESFYKLSFIKATTKTISLFLISVSTICSFGLGAWLSIKGFMTLGELMAFNVLSLAFNEPIIQAVQLGNQLHQFQVDYQRVMDITEYQQAEPIRPMSSQVSQFGTGVIEIIDLTFGYSRLERPLFKNLNLTIKKGTKVAVVGLSGSGKSTLIHLISGLYTPWSGTILIDGVPLSTISSEKRSKLIAVVSQEHFFFKGSVRDNLCLWGSERSYSDLMRVVKDACIDDLITQTVEGFDFELMEGARNLSGGQRQRLEIARTLLINAPILLLDEATSAMDTCVEVEINKNINKYMHTTITVAHRFNSVVDADRILILNQGMLVDSGSHQDLISKESPYYCKLFNQNEELTA